MCLRRSTCTEYSLLLQKNRHIRVIVSNNLVRDRERRETPSHNKKQINQSINQSINLLMSIREMGLPRSSEPEAHL